MWKYVNRFGGFESYSHKVKATAQGRVYQLPVNLLTINQFFGTTMSPREAQAFIAARADTSIEQPVSFEDQGLQFLGKELYEAFFAGYTRKQWGVEPSELPAAILKRLPLRFTYEDTYFDHPYIGIPTNGYTALIESILAHPSIAVTLGHALVRDDIGSYDHCFWTGPIDDYFGHSHGRLAYRTLDFDMERYDGDFQGCPVMNYCDAEVPYTRTTEFKHFARWENHGATTVYREFSRSCGPDDIPYYPVRQVHEKQQLLRYIEMARGAERTTFLGRLGTYRYLDMDVTVKEAIDAAAGFLAKIGKGEPAPPFFVDPLGR